MDYWLRIFGKENPDGTYGLSSGTDSLVTSILSAGTFVGALTAYFAGDRLGRRYGIICYLVRLICRPLETLTDKPLEQVLFVSQIGTPKSPNLQRCADYRSLPADWCQRQQLPSPRHFRAWPACFFYCLSSPSG